MSRPHQQGKPSSTSLSYQAIQLAAKFGEYITQVYGTGPLGVEYLNRRDDRRNTS